MKKLIHIDGIHKMKKILILVLGFSCSAFAESPIAPPKVEIADKFGVNLESGQLARTLKTVSIGGELGLSHNVQLYTDLWLEGAYGFADAFAGSVKAQKISENIITFKRNGNDILSFQDSGAVQKDDSFKVRVMRAYGPAGSQDFMVYANNDYVSDSKINTLMSGYSYRAVGDVRHSLTESGADRRYLIWTTPDGTETKYDRVDVPYSWPASTGGSLKEITYPNGFKIRVSPKGITTNTGFMLKYQFTSGWNTPDQIVGINLANQYCSLDAASCTTTGWPTATFIWPVGSPQIFKQSGQASSSYLVKLATNTGVTEIQYQPENLCITDNFNEDAVCAANPPGGSKWSPRLRSIKTPDSTLPNYEYHYHNIGQLLSGSPDGYFPYWDLSTRAGQVTSATVNGTYTESYSGPTVTQLPALREWHSSGGPSGANHITVVSPLYEPSVIQQVRSNTAGVYDYYRDLRRLVEFYSPIAGLGPKKHYYYEGPRGNLTRIMAVAGSETRLQQAEYVPTTDNKCIYPKTCNKPWKVTDANGNVTEYEYDPEGRFGNPIKITGPANKKGVRPATVYTYAPLYASYKKDGETITQDPDPIWMLISEHTCRTVATTSTGCEAGAPGTPGGGDLDMIKTTYDYGPQVAGQPNNLLLRKKSVTAEGCSPGNLVTQVWSYEYDKYGNRIGETQPKGNAGTTSCNP